MLSPRAYRAALLEQLISSRRAQPLPGTEREEERWQQASAFKPGLRLPRAAEDDTASSGKRRTVADMQSSGFESSSMQGRRHREAVQNALPHQSTAPSGKCVVENSLLHYQPPVSPVVSRDRTHLDSPSGSQSFILSVMDSCIQSGMPEDAIVEQVQFIIHSMQESLALHGALHAQSQLHRIREYEIGELTNMVERQQQQQQLSWVQGQYPMPALQQGELTRSPSPHSSSDSPTPVQRPVRSATAASSPNRCHNASANSPPFDGQQQRRGRSRCSGDGGRRRRTPPHLVSQRHHRFSRQLCEVCYGDASAEKSPATLDDCNGEQSSHYHHGRRSHTGHYMVPTHASLARRGTVAPSTTSPSPPPHYKVGGRASITTTATNHRGSLPVRLNRSSLLRCATTRQRCAASQRDSDDDMNTTVVEMDDTPSIIYPRDGWNGANGKDDQQYTSTAELVGGHSLSLLTPMQPEHFSTKSLATDGQFAVIDAPNTPQPVLRKRTAAETAEQRQQLAPSLSLPAAGQQLESQVAQWRPLVGQNVVTFTPIQVTSPELQLFLDVSQRKVREAERLLASTSSAHMSQIRGGDATATSLSSTPQTQTSSVLARQLRMANDSSRAAQPVVEEKRQLGPLVAEHHH